MAFDAEIERVYQLMDADDYDTAETLILRLRRAGCVRSELLLFEALCSYERADDVRCLELITQFLKKAPNHGKRYYALFTASVCLINLGLEKRARRLLEQVPPSYPDREKEMKFLRSILSKKKRAAECADEILKMLGEP